MDRFSCRNCGVTVWRGVLALMLAGNLGIALAAGDLSRAQQLLEQGDLKQAKTLLDAHLASQPYSVEGRFLKGVILARRNESVQAIEVFSQLIRDEPKLLEAYNNLAVLYARQQDYDKARATLEAATKADPTFSVISGNLKTTYGWLASKAYDKALGQNGAAAPVSGRMVLLGKLRETAAPKVLPVAEPTRPPAIALVAPVPTLPAAPAASSVLPVAPAAVVAKPASNAVATAEPKLLSRPEADVRQALDDWVAAWQSKDIKGYLAAYAADFTPAGGLKRKVWEEERHKRIAKKKGSIQLRLEGVQIKFKQDIATVQFKQYYKLGDYSDSTHKTMVFSKRGSRWRITSESTK